MKERETDSRSFTWSERRHLHARCSCAASEKQLSTADQSHISWREGSPHTHPRRCVGTKSYACAVLWVSRWRKKRVMNLKVRQLTLEQVAATVLDTHLPPVENRCITFDSTVIALCILGFEGNSKITGFHPPFIESVDVKPVDTKGWLDLLRGKKLHVSGPVQFKPVFSRVNYIFIFFPKTFFFNISFISCRKIPTLQNTYCCLYLVLITRYLILFHLVVKTVNMIKLDYKLWLYDTAWVQPYFASLQKLLSKRIVWINLEGSL